MQSWRLLQRKEHRPVTRSLRLKTPRLTVTLAGTRTSLLSVSAPFQMLSKPGSRRGEVSSTRAGNATAAPPATITRRYDRTDRRYRVTSLMLCCSFCSWCGPPPDGWAVPVSCVQDKENSGKCSSALISLGNCTVYPQINTVLCNSQVFASHIHTLSDILLITSLLPKAF